MRLTCWHFTDPTIHHANLPLQFESQGGIMRSHKNQTTLLTCKLNEQFKNHLPIRNVQVARWLVGQNNGWAVNDGTSKRCSLALTARNIGRQVLPSMTQADMGQHLVNTVLAYTPSHARTNERRLDILSKGHGG